MMLYLVTARGFSSRAMTRKNHEVASCFKRVTDTDVICGKDIYADKGEGGGDTLSTASYYSKWYRQGKLMQSLSQSYAEIKNIIHNFRLYYFIKKQDKKKNYTLICERSTNLGWAGILFGKTHHIPTILEWKDHLIKDYWSFFKPFAIFIERWKNKNADFIFVESQVLKKQLINEGVDERKIYVAYNAVNPDEFSRDKKARSEVRKELHIAEDDLVVGYVGSYAFYHDSIRMLKAAKILKGKGYEHIKWLLIGDGKDKAECKNFAKNNSLLENTVIMLPFQSKERIPHYLSAMDVTILPGSTDIICPIKVMEYMAAQSVVLVPDYDCNREIINGTNGLLFKSRNENSIADALIKVYGDLAIREQLGREARKTIIQTLTWDKTYGACLKKVIAKINGKNENSN